MSSGTGAGVVAAFNFSSAIGRLICGLSCDKIGPLNTLFTSLLLSAVSMLVLWPLSDSIGPIIAFAIINGVANGGFFSTIPTVISNVFGSARVSVAMGMTVTGWVGGYLMVRLLSCSPLENFHHRLPLDVVVHVWSCSFFLGRSHRWLHSWRIRRCQRGHRCISPSYILCGIDGAWSGRVGRVCKAEDQ